VGATKRPAYRVIAIDKRRSRDGRALEILGYYDPLTEPATVHLETDRINAWIGKGAQPSETVVKLMRQAEQAAAGDSGAEKPKRATRSASRPSKKASAKAADETATPAAEPAGAEAAESAAPAAEAPAAEAGGEPATESETREPAAGDGEKAEA
jgi:small subunit ribosomal protein S16